MRTTSTRISRRRLLAGAGGLALSVPFIHKSYGAEQLVVRDAGGALNRAAKAAFYEPFMKATGVTIVDVTSQLDPLSQIRTIVDSKSYLWDVSQLSLQASNILGASGYLDTIDTNLPYIVDVEAAMKSQWCVSFQVFATVLSYSTRVYGENGPKHWADFFDTQKFPGRRALRRSPTDTLEIALLADGVALDKVYPLDIARALAKLDTIKNDVAVWWSSGAQASQLIATSEVDMVATYNGRVQVAIDDGAPYKIEWNQGIWAADGYSVPKGNPKAALAKEFVQFCARPEQQAIYSMNIPYGSPNPKAYDHIPAERQLLLPSAPGRLEKMIMEDYNYWTANLENVTDRFNQWLLK